MFLMLVAAMRVMGINEAQQLEVLRVVAAVMHLSNISFDEQSNDAFVLDTDCERRQW